MKYLYLLILPALTACSSFKNQNVNPKRETIDHGVVRPISSIDSTVPNISLTNVHVVSQKDGKITALRGNFPWTEENYQDLNKLGVKKVIVFKNNKNNEINREKNKLIEHGLKKENITHIDFDWKDNNPWDEIKKYDTNSKLYCY